MTKEAIYRSNQEFLALREYRGKTGRFAERRLNSLWILLSANSSADLCAKISPYYM